ncbi:MAG TPA: response regulator [Vicinamibacterales bacterium]|nr:response regulator [Vicinamibacterales bacterium]
MTSLLVVDDEPRVRAVVVRWLRSREFSVAEAGTAGEALDQMAENPPAIAMCDVGLPDRNGLWLAGQMRRQFPHTALVITTGFGITALPSNLEAEAIGYLPKPFTEQQLLRTLEWAIEWRHEQKEHAS